ncbi:hypothetical protein AB0876_03845 [Mycobacterium sp. NPDC049093]
MTDRIETVIATQFAADEGDPSNVAERHRNMARGVLAALKSARIAVVELKGEDDAEVDAQEWATSSALCARYFDDSPGLIYVWDKAHAWDHGADPITPTQAHELAVALLSAAAEASQ